MPIDFCYQAHAGQQAIHDASDVRFRTVCTGRRFGKTLCLAAELLYAGMFRRGGDYGWIAPTYNVAERGIEAFRTIADGFVRVVGRMPTRVEFEAAAGPVKVWFLSADNPDNIRGYGFQGIVVDEAAMISPDVWHYVLRPTIAQTLGWAVFVSTPKGHNWFFDMFTRGLDPEEPDYCSFSFPSSQSPFFPKSEWEDAKRTLPEDVFRQEYEAEFLEDSAGVFRGIDRCLIPWELLTTDDAASGGELNHEWTRINTNRDKASGKSGVIPAGSAARDSATAGLNGEGKEKNHGLNGSHGLMLRGAGKVRNWVIGCDVAKHTDFTVLIAMDAETGRCYGMERFNQLDWPIQKERILGFCQRYPGRLILDATGIGDPIYDDLKRVWSDIEGFKLTSGSKTELIQRLIVAVEQRRVAWPGKVSRRVAEGAEGDAASGSLNHELTRMDTNKDKAFPRKLSHAGGQAGDVGVIRSAVAQANSVHGASNGMGIATSGETWGILTNEMKRYEYEISAAGRISYNAPSGYHDDCVMALALANHGRWETGNCGRMLPLRNPAIAVRQEGRPMEGRRRRTLGLGMRRSRVLMG